MSFALVTGLLLGLLGAQQFTNFIGVPAGLVLSAAFYISLLFCFNDSFGGSVPPGVDNALPAEQP